MFCASRVVFSRTAYNKIQHTIQKANNQYEVGGILLGHKILQIYFVVEVTALIDSTKKSTVSFFLDGEKHTVLVTKIMHRFKKTPMILGVWHSHIYGINNFSNQDRISNKQLAKAMGGILSTLAVTTESKKKLRLTTYSISSNGKELSCCTIISMHNKLIPKKYIATHSTNSY